MLHVKRRIHGKLDFMLISMAVSSDYTPATQALQERRGTHAAAGPRSSGGGSGAGGAAGAINTSSVGNGDGNAGAAGRSRHASTSNFLAGDVGGSGSARPLLFMCPASSGPAVVGADDITAMTWLAFARPPGELGWAAKADPGLTQGSGCGCAGLCVHGEGGRPVRAVLRGTCQGPGRKAARPAGATLTY